MKVKESCKFLRSKQYTSLVKIDTLSTTSNCLLRENVWLKENNYNNPINISILKFKPLHRGSTNHSESRFIQIWIYNLLIEEIFTKVLTTLPLLFYYIPLKKSMALWETWISSTHGCFCQLFLKLTQGFRKRSRNIKRL